MIVKMSLLGSSSLFCQEVTNQNKSGIAILVSEERDFLAKSIITIKDDHDLMIKGPIHQGDINNTELLFTQ